MSYQLINLDSNIALSWAYPFTGGVVVANINDVSASADGYTLTLPPANLVPTGTTLLFNNIGFHHFIILDNIGLPITGSTIAPGGIIQIYLTSSTLDCYSFWRWSCAYLSYFYVK